MKFDVITIFPKLIENYLKEGLLGKAIQNKKIEVQTTNPRDFTTDRHQTVDDKPYGGDDGMVFTYGPLKSAVAKAKLQNRGRVIYLSPQGKPLTQTLVQELSKEGQLILVSARYAGIDQRWINEFVDLEISVGDYVLMGGELPALTLIEAVARQIDDVLSDPESKTRDSFTDGLLEAPQFTRPERLADHEGPSLVPRVLVEGHHQKIKEWRNLMAYLVTLQKRPDLFARKLSAGAEETREQVLNFYRKLSNDEKASCGLGDLEHLLEDQRKGRLSVALFHYPMQDREKKIVATNITHFDIHDIARASRVNGVKKYFVVHPLDDQLAYVERILDHWRVGAGSKFNPFRRLSLENVISAANLEQVLRHFPERPLIVATHARPVGGSRHFSCRELHEIVAHQDRDVLLLFGTGFGFPDEFMVSECDGTLESLRGAPPDDFRHYSVRSAVSIYLDRIVGQII